MGACTLSHSPSLGGTSPETDRPQATTPTASGSRTAPGTSITGPAQFVSFARQAPITHIDTIFHYEDNDRKPAMQARVRPMDVLTCSFHGLG
ncbi:hypothetical protein CEXT_114641 [Caerostris extrusa]|uniref:Uncharacterized protein n=1 Tax=Caerostris extrusa TaxID=172846 RepID=A0AAV4X3V5_CAEEX|nr:hypothetical protein CEXT_114641 [Caerostris extrusa]